MNDTLIIIAVVIVGSIICTGLQTLTWFVGIRSLYVYRNVRGLTIGAVIAAPLLVLFLVSLRFLLGFSTDVAEIILMPVGTAWIFLLSWGSLRIAARLTGLHLAPSNSKETDEQQ